MHLVLIDDDHDTHTFLTAFLNAEGFEVHSAYDGPAGIEIVQERQPAAVFLDIDLPDIDGWDICRRIREFSDVPILMITAFAKQDHDIIYGLNIGADDYVLKPIQLDVLKARLTAVLRRSNAARPNHHQVYVDSHLMIDLGKELLTVEGKRISLSYLEYRLLELLVINRPEPIPLEEIIETLWTRFDDPNYAQYVRIYIRRLRERIEPDSSKPVYIVTEHGFGYRFLSQ